MLGCVGLVFGNNAALIYTTTVTLCLITVVHCWLKV